MQEEKAEGCSLRTSSSTGHGRGVETGRYAALEMIQKISGQFLQPYEAPFLLGTEQPRLARERLFYARLYYY